MRREALYLVDILEAAGAIEEFVSGVEEDSFLVSDLLRSAVLHKLAVIGEAAARVPREVRDRYPDTDWPQIIDFRNRLVHQYFALDLQIIWRIVTVFVPQLRQQVEVILARDYPELNSTGEEGP